MIIQSRFYSKDKMKEMKVKNKDVIDKSFYLQSLKWWSLFGRSGFFCFFDWFGNLLSFGYIRIFDSFCHGFCFSGFFLFLKSLIFWGNGLLYGWSTSGLWLLSKLLSFFDSGSHCSGFFYHFFYLRVYWL